MVWHRPLLSTYSDNYRYGTSLYNNFSVGDAEKKYRESLHKTSVRSDRGDLGMYSFVGSHVHGGTPAIDTGIVPIPSSGSGKSTATSDLYAPMSFGYGRGYYNHLRADYQKPRARDSKMPSAADYFSVNSAGMGGGTEPLGADLKTHTAKSKSIYDDTKKTVTTTTTTERWVPLSNYLYGYPAYYYHYSSPAVRSSKTTDDLYYSTDATDDYYKSTTTTSKSRTLDALDLNVSSSSMEKFDYNLWMEKCRDIHQQLEQVNHWIGEADTKMKTDVVGARNKMQSELTEVTLLVEDTTKYNEELQRVIKRQARQISDLHSQYDDINRHLVDVNDTLEKSRVRCQSLAADLISVQSGLEMVVRRK